MVIGVQGTASADNDMTGIASLVAVMSALKKKKTLILQLSQSEDKSALFLLEGKELNEGRTSEMSSYRMSDKGIDALLRRANTIRLTQDNFETACEDVMDYNFLDVADTTTKIDFREGITVEGVSNIIKYANEIYDNIILIIDAKDHEDGAETTMSDMLGICDICITCVPQCPNKDIFNPAVGKKNIFVIPKFDSMSKYSLQYMKKLYGQKKMYALPYNSGYHDAKITGTLYRFVLANKEIDKDDNNSIFMSAISKIMDDLQDAEEKKAANDEAMAEDLREAELEKQKELEKVEQFSAHEVEVKSGPFGLFKKKEMKIGFDVTDEPFETPEALENDEDDDNAKLAEEILSTSAEEAVNEDIPDDSISDEVVENETSDVPAKKVKKHFGFFKKKRKQSDEDETVLDETSFNNSGSDIEEVIADAEDFTEEEINSMPMFADDVPTDDVKVNSGEMRKINNSMLHSKIISVSDNEKGDDLPIDVKSMQKIHLDRKGLIEPSYIEKPILKKIKEWYCPDCGKLNTDLHCTVCGAPKPEETWECPSCGTKNNGKYCSHCGLPKDN